MLKQKFKKNAGEGNKIAPSKGTNRVVKTTPKGKAQKTTKTKPAPKSEDETDSESDNGPVTPPKTPVKYEAMTPAPVTAPKVKRSSPRGRRRVNYAVVNDPFTNNEEESDDKLHKKGHNDGGKSDDKDKFARGKPVVAESDEESLNDFIKVEV